VTVNEILLSDRVISAISVNDWSGAEQTIEIEPTFGDKSESNKLFGAAKVGDDKNEKNSKNLSI
jgi:hypothetical protein